MIALILGALMALVPTAVMGQQTYTEAYLDAIENDKPLLVLVESDGCPPCTALKQGAMSTLLQARELEDISYAVVNSSRESVLTQRLQVRSTPTLILYYKRGDGWVSHRLIGNQTANRVRSFIGRARMVVTSSTPRTMLASIWHDIVARRLSPGSTSTLHDDMQR